MPTGSWVQRSRDRLSACKAIDYLIDVAEGEIEKPNRDRLKACEFIVNKVLPNPPTMTHEIDAEQANQWQLKL